LSSRLQHLRQTAKSAVLTACGLTWVARRRLAGQAAVLNFHGLCEKKTAAGVLNDSLNLPLPTFRAVCRHLSVNYKVMPLAEMMNQLDAGQALPRGAVAITFDDGLASNYHLAFPVLKELGLPATIFLATGFLDHTHPLWFQEVDVILRARGASKDELSQTLSRLKTLPDPEMRAQIAKLGPAAAGTAPASTLPLTWDQVREMKASGLIEFGGHTHTHPILAQCTAEQQAEEIRKCRERITSELGAAPTLFAYPNGGAADFTEETRRLLAEQGFTSAFTMMPARVTAASPRHALPRYGNPTSVMEARATASGAFELCKRWRGGGA
jgi:peptidoglycan/xylan/chitin deacetylase (PgdA/CDA1 family)